MNAPTGRRIAIAVLIALAAGSATIASLAAGGEHAGPQGDGTAITPIGWKIAPAGTQTELGERPYGAALSPSGKTLLVSNDGLADQTLMSVDTGSGLVTSTVHYPPPEALFIGVAISPDGTKAYASAGSQNEVRTYTLAGEPLLASAPVEGLPISLKTTDAASNPVEPFPAGLAISKDGTTLYVADHLANALSIVDLASSAETVVPIISAKCVIGPYGDESNGKNCAFAYTVALSRSGDKAYVSNWGQNTLSAVDTKTKTLIGQIKVGNHPSAMATSPTRDELYVANTDGDSISVVDTNENRVKRTISLAPYEHAPVGANPDGLAVSPDGKTLYVANSGDNDVAVVRLDGSSNPVAGLIPTGWYPTGVAVSPDGTKLYVTSGKGLGAGPNPGGPAPPAQYTGSMIKGTLSTIPVPDASQLAAYTTQVLQAGRLAPRKATTRPADKIKHVIYIVNENRTYDQVLGDLGRGNGDPALTLFGSDVTPNHHQLARQFTTLDNLYAAGEVSDDGWEWSTAANANTLTQKTMPTNYGFRRHFYVAEGGTLAAAPGFDPAKSYIWNALDAKGISYRNYGFWATGTPPVKVFNAPTLDAHTDHAYPGFNLSTPDQVRFAEWKKEFDRYVAGKNLPAVEFLKFPSDHTCGTDPTCPTTRAMVADSDLATGKLVDAVSHSPYWSSTAIFVIEDDAQDGGDHVDAHRTVAHVISPYTQTGKVDSTFYSTVSLLRTMEDMIGVPPLTQFDAHANPMWPSFTSTPSFAPYTARTPSQPLTMMNTRSAPLARESAAMDFSREDRAPHALLNRAIWESVKGANTPMPAPVHRQGVPEDEDD